MFLATNWKEKRDGWGEDRSCSIPVFMHILRLKKCEEKKSNISRRRFNAWARWKSNETYSKRSGGGSEPKRVSVSFHDVSQINKWNVSILSLGIWDVLPFHCGFSTPLRVPLLKRNLRLQYNRTRSASTVDVDRWKHPIVMERWHQISPYELWTSLENQVPTSMNQVLMFV